MGLLGLSVDDALNDLQQKFLNPFKPKLTKAEIKDAHARNDFKKGFIIAELINNTFNEDRRDTIKLVGDMMPHVPFTFGGQQKIVKDYYPGNSEPTVQVLGPRENDIIIRGRLKSKKLQPPPVRTGINLGGLGNAATGFLGKIPGVPDISPGVDAQGVQKREELRTFAQEMQQLIEAMRLRGNLVRLTMGEFQRFGFIEEAIFNMRTVADIDYEVRFSIIGFNPPRDCKILGRAKTVPFDINKDLIAEASAFLATRSSIPDSMPRSIADQISDAISEVAESINLVTGFVDTALNEVDDIKSALNRAVGLVKYNRNLISSFIRRIGSIASFGGLVIASGGGIAAGYENANFLKQTTTFSFSLAALLASLQTQLAQIALTEPIARHRIQEGDTLQKLAIKFYNDAEQWKEIYDHNKLQDTDLSDNLGDILEIPRIT